MSYIMECTYPFIEKDFLSWGRFFQMYQTIANDISSIKQGNNLAFEKLYKSYYNPLFFFAIQYLKEDGDAENMVQETFLAFWLNRENFNGTNETSVRAWLYNTIKNKCLNYLDKENNKHKYVNHQRQALDLEVLKELEISEVTFNEIESLLQEALELMTPQCRRVFELSRFKGLKNKDIAEEMNITVKAVEGNMTRALKLLKTHLHDYLPLCIILNIL